jgi:copper chaperone CopZ
MAKDKKLYKIKGMDCASCAKLIELDLEDAGISANCSWAKQTLEVDHPEEIEKIKEIVTNSGYKLIV